MSACAGSWNGEGRVHSGKAQKAVTRDAYTVLNVRGSREPFHFRTCQLFSKFSSSSLLLDPTLGIRLTLGNWTVSFVPGASSQPFPCLSLCFQWSQLTDRQASGVQPRSHSCPGSVTLDLFEQKPCVQSPCFSLPQICWAPPSF